MSRISLFDTTPEWTPETDHQYNLRFKYHAEQVECNILLGQALVSLIDTRIATTGTTHPPNYKESYAGVNKFFNAIVRNINTRRKLRGDYARWTIQPLEDINEYESVLVALNALQECLKNKGTIIQVHKTMDNLIEELRKVTAN